MLEVIDLMHCYKLNDMLILRKMKNNDTLESILELDFSPLGELGSGTESRFFYRNRV